MSDLPITSTKGSHPERLLAHVKAQGSFSSDGKPRPGDLVFFRATELDSDPESRHPTLAGVVERVDSSGTVHFLSALGDTVDRSVLDPSRKDLRRDQRRGRVINSYLRVRGANDPPETRYLAGQLMLGFGRI